MNFSDMIGQKELIESLVNALKSDRVGHACIFSGPSGIGKKTAAQIYAGMLLCEALSSGDRCCSCQACRLFDNGSNPDFRTVKADGASIGVDAIRDIQSNVAVKPMYSRRKVYIIEEADKMTVQAQNCLLKTLEEPPSYAVIILTTSNYEALLETIRSRSRRSSFKKYTNAQVRQAVADKFGPVARGIDFAVAYADGVIGTALQLVGTEELLALREKTFEMAGRLKKAGLSGVFGAYGFFEENKEDIDIILDILSLLYRDMLVAGETGDENILINSDKKDMIFNNAREYSPQQLVSGIEHIEAARRAIKQNANYQLAIEHMLIKLQEE